MFTGIIETLASVVRAESDRSNLELTLETPLAGELKVDQSLAHNGVCLTVVEISGARYRVTAVKETLNRSNLGDLQPGDVVNLERAMKLGDRLDGHIVQGHVDLVGRCTAVEPQNGSWVFRFAYDPGAGHVTVEKGSITVDGVSLTVVDSAPGSFSVAIIPYTYEHTRFKSYKKGSRVNLEFDMIGKYVARLLQPHQP